MHAQKVFLLLLDISGYTRFIKFHKISLIHAERIIDELLERVIAEVHPPLVLQELEGDAIYFYAISDGSREMAREISNQVKRGLAAFKEREAELISECSICLCEACKVVGRLTMKAVLHYGEAVFTQVRQFNKLSGEDVILVHRLLKAPIENKEHVLVTESMHTLIGDLDGKAPEVRTEDLGELGHVRINVYYASNESRVLASRASVLTKLKRLVVPASRRYQNLEASQPKSKSERGAKWNPCSMRPVSAAGASGTPWHPAGRLAARTCGSSPAP